LVLLKGGQDDIVGDHMKISNAELIADAIIAKLQFSFNNDVVLRNINGISLREFSDNNLSGVRFDITATMKRAYCSTAEIDEVFNDCEC
jgi:hypothetical protein